MTEPAACLREDVVGSVRDWTVLTGTKPTWDAFGEALEVVRTGRCGFELAHGEAGDLYRYCRQDSEFSETFIRAQSNWTDWQRDAILEAYDFSKFPTIVDVGGGRGSMISGILRRCPETKGVLCDQPQTIELAKTVIANAGVADRCQLAPGNFLENVPEGGDAYVIKHVLRDWDDANAGTILRNCHQAMGPNGTLLLIDAVLDPRNSRDRIVKLLDLEQMFWLSGSLRTMDAWKRLLGASGFRIQQCHKTKIVDAIIVQAVKTGG
ncbi:MAG TPA: methyltransferase [Pirellulaceae bacterium]|nr:methyltransferase [Pirellulaceae bacterium]